MAVRFRKYGMFYMLGGFAALWLKYRYSHAGSEELLWLLAPVAWWAGSLGGLSFVHEQGVGYVEHAARFIIAPSCSGVQFLIIALAVFLFSFVHRAGTWKRGAVWTLFSLAGAYGYTILVNGVRIVLAVWIPGAMRQKEIRLEWLTQERLHTVIGVTVYFAALLLLYRSADMLMCRLESRSGISRQRAGEKSAVLGTGRYAVPIFWYLFIVLGVPFLNHAMDKDPAGYLEYAFLTGSVCLGITVLAGLIRLFRRRI
ncbi:MAG: exosortase K [Lachnospiraceae bacterium]|jgi:exosortase K|nr:exosortase K [Lachnospiraceae bacterium]